MEQILNEFLKLILSVFLEEWYHPMRSFSCAVQIALKSVSESEGKLAKHDGSIVFIVDVGTSALCGTWAIRVRRKPHECVVVRED